MRLYHGTDKESAHNIQKHGVDLTYSRQDTDFGQAFYLTNQKGLAKAWANRNFFTAGAVLTFEADLDSLSVKLFESINDEWKEAVFRARVRYSRCFAL